MGLSSVVERLTPNQQAGVRFPGALPLMSEGNVGGSPHWSSLLCALNPGNGPRYAEITQLVEYLICNQAVVGSSPIFGSK